MARPQIWLEWTRAPQTTGHHNQASSITVSSRGLPVCLVSLLYCSMQTLCLSMALKYFLTYSSSIWHLKVFHTKSLIMLPAIDNSMRKLWNVYCVLCCFLLETELIWFLYMFGSFSGPHNSYQLTYCKLTAIIWLNRTTKNAELLQDTLQDMWRQTAAGLPYAMFQSIEHVKHKA